MHDITVVILAVLLAGVVGLLGLAWYQVILSEKRTAALVVERDYLKQTLANIIQRPATINVPEESFQQLISVIQATITSTLKPETMN